MTTVYPTSYKIFAYLSGAWTDITADAIKDNISGSWGIVGNSPLDRLADTGSLTFTLNNKTGKYSPDLTGALVGWKKGTPIKFIVTYGGVDYIRFRGAVDVLRIESGTSSAGRVFVTVLDWLDYAAKYPLVSPGIQADKRADQALTTMVPTMPIQPQAISYDTGVNTFPALFDTVTTKTKAYTEFSKLALSEVGYIYLRKDRAGGETLVFESNQYRHGLRGLTNIPKSTAESGFLLKEDGGFLLKEDGGKIILDEIETLYVDNAMLAMETVYGDNLINRMTVMAYPKRVSTSPEILFTAASPIMIGSAETITFRGNYSDPVGGATVNAESSTMIAPVINTDYKMWTNQDGTGTDITANLTIVAVYGTEGVTYTLTNGSIYTGWVTNPKLQARGYGIYSYNPIESAQESAASYNEYGYQSATLHQQYQRELTSGILEAQKILEAEKQPRTVLRKINLNANRSGQMMQAFLNLDVGDLVRIKEDQTGIDGYYYIQGVEFSILPGGVIMFSWIVRQSFSLLMGLSLISCEFRGGATKDAINYGYLPQVSNLPQRTFSVWIYAHTAFQDYIMGPYSDKFGANIHLQSDFSIRFRQNAGPTGTSGVWKTPAWSVAQNAWVHIVATRDSSNRLNQPIIYIGGTAQNLTEEVVQSEATPDETGVGFFIGNMKTATVDYTWPFDGLIKDARVYNRILTATEAATLAAGGAVTDGLVFQSFCVRTKQLPYYTGKSLTSEDKLLDNVFGVVGSPHGSPITGVKLIGADDGIGVYEFAANTLGLGKYVAVASGNMTYFRIKCNAGVNIKGGIYADDAGAPGALLNSIPSTAIVAGWNAVVFPSTPIVLGTAYWLAFNADVIGKVAVHTSGGTTKYKALAYGSAFPNPAGVGFIDWGGQLFIAGWG